MVTGTMFATKLPPVPSVGLRLFLVFVIVAARPSMGKSALALCMAANLGVRHETPVALSFGRCDTTDSKWWMAE